MKLALLLLVLLTLPGCAIVAAGIGGIALEQQHRAWCQSHPLESNCWEYNR